MDFAVLADHRVKLKESEKKDKYLDLARELKKLLNMKVSDTNCNWCSWYSHQRIGTRTGGLGNKGMSGDYPNYSIIEISQNTKISPGDLRRLAFTQISSKKALANTGVKNSKKRKYAQPSTCPRK